MEEIREIHPVGEGGQRGTQNGLGSGVKGRIGVVGSEGWWLGAEVTRTATGAISSGLLPGVPTTPDGKRTCFVFNLGESVEQVAPRDRCWQGWHLYTRIGCHKPHAATAGARDCAAK